MEERKTLKEIYSKHKDAIKIAIFAILAIALFIGGYLVSWNFRVKPLNDSQFEIYEQVARDVYDQKENVMVEAPKESYVSITATTITVEATCPYRGEVIARLQNGKLAMTRNMKTGEAVFTSIVTGTAFVLVFALVTIVIDSIIHKKKSGK